MDGWQDNMITQDTYKEDLSDADLLSLARHQYQKAIQYWYLMWEKGRDDLEFLNGTNHWPEEILKERKADQRPCMTINHAPKYVRQVIGDQRQNRPQAKIRPVDGFADVDLAKQLSGLLRNIESNSNYKTVQDTAFRGSVVNGFGYIRIVTEYAGDDTFNQDVKYKRVYNPFSVVLDPSAVELDHSDGMFGFVTDWVPNEIFKEKWPDAVLSDFEAAERVTLTDWYHVDETLTAEWFRRIPIKKTLGLLTDGKTINMDGVDVTKTGQFGLMPDDTPIEVIKTKEVDAYKVMRYLISGKNVLEEGVEFPGIYIPLVPVWGEEIISKEGRRDFNSVIRFMKDPNRMLNYMRSAEVEHVALQPKAPYIGTARQFENHITEWQNANKKNVPFLPYTSDDEAKMPPQRQMPPQASSGIQAAIMQSKEDMKDTTGLFDASMGAPGKETSGKAILARQREGDVSTFVWIDNLTTATTHAAKIVLGIIPLVYDTERVVRINNVDGSEEFLEINKEIKGDDGKPLLVNDLSVGKYDVVVETGPSYSTQRAESADTLMEFARVMGPDTARLMGDLIAGTQDFTGAQDIADRLKKTLPPGIAELKEGETPPEPPPAPPPTAEEQLKSQELEIKAEELAVDKERIQLDYAKIDAEAKKIEVEVIKAQTEKGLNEEQVRTLILDMFKKLHEDLTEN